MNYITRRGLLLAACLLASHGAFAAGPVSASASLTNFRIELIDLRPDDGLTPWIEFGTRNGALTMELNSYWPFYEQDTMTSTRLTTLDLVLGDNRAWGAADAFGASARSSSLDRAAMSAVYSNLSFSLSPYTQVVFRGDVAASADFNPHVEQSFLDVGFTGYLSDWWSGYQPLAAGYSSDSGGSFDGTLSLNARTQADGAYGYLSMYASTQVWAPVTQVPEPAHGAMLLAGLAVLAWLGRRRGPISGLLPNCAPRRSRPAAARRAWPPLPSVPAA